MSNEVSEHDDTRVEQSGDRSAFAKFKTQLALDRTTLAWIRTTLSIAGFGFGLVGFFRALRLKDPTVENVRMHQGAIRFGTTLVVLGIVATILAAVSHWRTLQRLRQGKSPVLTQWPLSITIAMLLSIVGLSGLWAILAH